MYNDKIALGIQQLSQSPSSNALLRALGLKVTRVADREMDVVVSLDNAELAIPGRPIAHGGIVSFVTDHVLGMIFYPLCGDGAWVATNGFSISLLAPVALGSNRTLVGEGRVTYLVGASGVASVNCFVVDEHGTKVQVSTAQGTVRIVGRPKF